jgi:hypothetical protein
MFRMLGSKTDAEIANVLTTAAADLKRLMTT